MLFFSVGGQAFYFWYDRHWLDVTRWIHTDEDPHEEFSFNADHFITALSNVIDSRSASEFAAGSNCVFRRYRDEDNKHRIMYEHRCGDSWEFDSLKQARDLLLALTTLPR